jgi:hypothetical protein
VTGVFVLVGCATMDTTLVPSGSGTVALKFVALEIDAGIALTVTLLTDALVFPATV